MPKLIVKNFSVINRASLDPGKLTVLIGPQSSGKSLLCKLMYFFLESVGRATWAVAHGEPIKAFRRQTEDEFLARFPQNTWTGQEIELSYVHGLFEISLRTVSGGNPDLSLTFSSAFEDVYQSALHSVTALRSREKVDGTPEEEEPRIIEEYDLATEAIRPLLGGGERESQLFIPAGRAFFTTNSKSFAAAEGSSFDRITSRFGRLMARAFDEPPRIRTGTRTRLSAFEKISSALLGGKLEKGERPAMFKAESGRILSLSQLSSGIQELLPLILALEPFANSRLGRTIYVEEPEAHLFPATQYELVKLFAWLSNSRADSTRWLLTTHSPYILSAFNNLIMAGQLGRTMPDLKEDVATVVPEQFWIEGGSFMAYSIHDGELAPILSKSGLIDGEYLDSVSDTIGNEFDTLLRLEYDHTKAS